MGNVQIPQESELTNHNRHRVSIELNRGELSDTVEILKSSLQYLQAHQAPCPSSTLNVPAQGLPDLMQKVRINNMYASIQDISPVLSPPFQSISNIPSSHYQSLSNIPTSLPNISPAFAPSFPSISNIPSSHYQGISNIPSSLPNISPAFAAPIQSISNIPSSHYQRISNIPTSLQSISPALTPPLQRISSIPTTSCLSYNAPISPGHRSISIPRSYPLPIGTKKTSSSSPSFHGSTSSPSTSHCPPSLNLPRANVASWSTQMLSENQGAFSVSDINLAEAQLEQPNIPGEIRQELVEEAEVISTASMGSRDQGKVRIGDHNWVLFPEELSTWGRLVTTPATKHKKNAITAMCYLPSFEGFSNNSDDSSGWLISSSEKLLNLWQCTARNSVSEPSLQVKSFQRTEFVIEDMVVDMDAKFLCAFCSYPAEKALCITMHSLGGPAFFKYQGMIHIPCEDESLCTKKSSYRLKRLHLVPLQPMGGTFDNSVAAAFDKNICVYNLSSVSASPSTRVPPKTLWHAHDSPVSCMHLNSSVCSLITGSSDGCIQLWDMKAKPCSPVRHYHRKDYITCIEMLDGTTMCSSSLDGAIQLHDIRYNDSSFMSIVPNEKPIVNMASFPTNNTIAFTTVDRSFCLALQSSNSRIAGATSRHLSSGSTATISRFSSSLWTLMPLPSNELSTSIKWNTRTCTEIYTSQSDGSIAIFAIKDRYL